MRDTFSKELVRAARQDPRILLLTGDHGYALFDEFRAVCPGQYINAGVAEQNMVGVAAGLAKGGFRPVVYGLSAFIPIRVYEQIKLDVCYEKLPVVFMGDGAGVVYSTLGTSHQSTEDIAALRALPHLSILSPADEHEMARAMELSFRAEGPVYLRTGKADLGAVHASKPTFEWGDLCRLRDGQGPVGWIATGSMVDTALKAATHWPGGGVWSAPSLKPLDAGQVASVCRRHSVVVVLEEHSIYGGLGSAVTEIASAEAPCWVCRIGVADRFSKYCGSYEYLMREHELTPADTVRKVHAFLEKVPREQLVGARQVVAPRAAA